MEDNMIGTRIKEARERNGINKAELARRVDVSRASVSLWEDGGNITIDNIKKVASSLRVTPQWLQYGINNDKKIDINNLAYCLTKVLNTADAIEKDLSETETAQAAVTLYEETSRGFERDENSIAELLTKLVIIGEDSELELYD